MESEKLFNFINEATRVCKAQLYVNPDGMIFIDFRRSTMSVKQMYQETQIGELYGAIWEMPYDKSGHYSSVAENKIMSKQLPPWLIRRSRNEHYEPLQSVEEDQRIRTPSDGAGSLIGPDVYKPEIVDYAMYGFVDGSGVLTNPRVPHWAT